MKNIAAVLGVSALSVPLGLAAPLFAGGLVVVEDEPVIVAAEPVLPTGIDWSGAYLGGQLGYADVDSNGAALDGFGTFGGLHIGYRWDMGTFVVGAELDYDVLDVDLGAVAGDTLDNVTRLKLIGGTEIGTGLLYGTIGAASAQAAVAGVDLSDSGYLYGAGVTYPVWDRWTVGAEVLQHNFDDFDGTGVDFDATTVTARLGFRF